MRESVNLVALWALLLVYSYPADAQQPKRIPRIGYLTVASLSDLSENLAAFRRGLRERGYVEGNSIVVEWRSSEGKRGRASDLAAELVRLKVDLISLSPGGSGSTLQAKKATESVPHRHV